MKKYLIISILTILTILVSCREDIVIDIEEGTPMIGIEAKFTDEMKQHEVIVSYTADFYNSSDIPMVSGAKVCITDGVDSVYFTEDANNKGHYFSPVTAGKRNTSYTLYVDVPDEAEEDGFQHFYAESYLGDNVQQIDSLVMKPYGLITFSDDTILAVYPYFQSLDDQSVTYMLMISKNDTLVSDTLTDLTLIPMAGYAGYYINGEQFLQQNVEIPVAMFHKNELRIGDEVKIFFYNVPFEYMFYAYSLKLAMGSNPMLGTPSNVSSNIMPEGKAVGWFYAASLVTKSIVWQGEDWTVSR